MSLRLKSMTVYRLRKSLKIFKKAFHLYKKKQKRAPNSLKREFVKALTDLQEEILNRDRTQASHCAKVIESLKKIHFSRTGLESFFYHFRTLLFAILVAILIRTIWFEIYEIPSGSMRPTFKEKDRLLVSKTTFGINTPFYNGHLFFDPNLVQRMSTVVFKADGINLPDTKTLHFHLFPGTKNFVKRLIGKPGNTLYFYGGQIYGVNQQGVDISSELQVKKLSKIDHVPYIRFNGAVNLTNKGAILSQMNQKVAFLSLDINGKAKGELLEPYRSKFNDYYDLWGFNTYGMARLLTKQEAFLRHGGSSADRIKNLEDAPLYMEIAHHPSVKYPRLEQDRKGQLFPGVGLSHAILPLNETHLKRLMSNLYTARFTVKNGMALGYGSAFKGKRSHKGGVPLRGVPDGTYEFYEGKGYKIHFGGTRSELASDHPLYTFSPDRVQTLYNLGIEWNTAFGSNFGLTNLYPSRYVYYKEGSLCALGGVLMKKEDPFLIRFIADEYLKQQNASLYHPYFPFDDAPLKRGADGKIDKDFIKERGITVPSKQYLVLGDNYAQSCDSREFGFVPESSIRGAPIWIFWPPGSRFGTVLQVAYPFFNSPRMIVFSLFFVCVLIGTAHHFKNKHLKLPVKIDE